MTPKGKLMLIGGNIDKGTVVEEGDRSHESIQFFELGILKRIITELKGEDSRIEIITTASEIWGEIGKEYIRAFNKIGCTNVGLLPFRTIIESKSDKVIERIKECDGIIFTGGDQLTLVKKLANTKAIKTIKSRYQRDTHFLVSGTSAGAMALAKLMIEKGRPSQSLIKGNVTLGSGFGFVNNLLIDSHFVQRGRFSRLIEAISSKPAFLGIGLGEDTAVLLKNGILETVGSNLVCIIDGKNIRKNTYKSIPAGRAICIENINVHILAKGHKFNLESRKIL